MTYIRQYNSSNINSSIGKIAVIYEKNNRYGALYKQYFQRAFLKIGGKVLHNGDPDQDECRFDIGTDIKSQVQTCMQKLGSIADALLLVPS